MQSSILMQIIDIILEQDWGKQKFFNQNFGSILSAPNKLTGLIFFYHVLPILLFHFSPKSWTKTINFQFSSVLINGGWLLAFGLQILVTIRLSPKCWYRADRTDQKLPLARRKARHKFFWDRSVGSHRTPCQRPMTVWSILLLGRDLYLGQSLWVLTARVLP